MCRQPRAESQVGKGKCRKPSEDRQVQTVKCREPGAQSQSQRARSMEPCGQSHKQTAEVREPSVWRLTGGVDDNISCDISRLVLPHIGLADFNDGVLLNRHCHACPAPKHHLVGLFIPVITRLWSISTGNCCRQGYRAVRDDFALGHHKWTGLLEHPNSASQNLPCLQCVQRAHLTAPTRPMTSEMSSRIS